jgi:hypothetical protein
MDMSAGPTIPRGPRPKRESVDSAFDVGPADDGDDVVPLTKPKPKT